MIASVYMFLRNMGVFFGGLEEGKEGYDDLKAEHLYILQYPGLVPCKSINANPRPFGIRDFRY